MAVACTITGAHPSAMLLRIFQDVLSGHGSNDLAAIAQDVGLLRLLPPMPTRRQNIITDEDAQHQSGFFGLYAWSNKIDIHNFFSLLGRWIK